MFQQHDIETDDSTIALVYQQHAPALFAYLCMHISSKEDAKDLLTEIFLVALEKQQFCELPQEQQRSWLWRVARNKVADHYRTVKQRTTLPLDDVAETMYDSEEAAPEHVSLLQEEHARLHDNIQRLSPQQQRVLQLRFVNNLRCTEIATVLGKSEGAVRMMLFRTLNLLRSIYEQH